MTVVDTIKDKAGSVVSSVSDFNAIAVDKLEEVSNINIASIGYFSNTLVKQLRSLTSVRDADSFRKFTADSISLSGDLAKRVLDDSKAWLNLGVDFTKKTTDLLKGANVDVEKKSAIKSVAA